MICEEFFIMKCYRSHETPVVMGQDYVIKRYDCFLGSVLIMTSI